MHTAYFTIVLALLTMVGPLGIDTYLPSFNAIATDFNAPAVVVQQTLSLYVAAMAVMMLFYGTLSDSFGRKRVMMASLVLYIVTSVAAAFATSIGALIVIRALQGLSAGAGIVISRAMVQDRFSGPHAQRVISLIMVVFGVAPALAPIIGGWLQATLGWRANFWFLAIFGSLLLAASIKGLPETLAPELRQPFRFRSIMANYGRSLRHPHFLLMALALALVFCGVPLYVGSAAAFVMGILHQSETSFGWLFLPLVGGLVSGSAVAGRLAHTVSMSRLIAAGCTFMFIAAISNVTYNLFFVAAVPWAVVPIGIYTFGVALAMPGMSVMAMEIFPDMRGLASSMQGFIQMILFSIVTGVIAPLIFDHALWLALGQLAAISLGAGLWAIVHRLRTRGA